MFTSWIFLSSTRKPVRKKRFGEKLYPKRSPKLNTFRKRPGTGVTHSCAQNGDIFRKEIPPSPLPLHKSLAKTATTKA